jgi:NAD(P)-dependent dehydrogenase (short-subunit alcohol dehydrogenase family)
MNRKQVLILGGSSDIGIEIIKIYLQNDYLILAHYNKGTKKFFDLVKKNRDNINKIKFNFLSGESKVEKFFKKREIIKSDIFINALGSINDTNYENLRLKVIEKSLKINAYPGIYATSVLGKKMAQKKWGRIVNLGSIGVKFGGGQTNFPYSLAKFILEFFPSYTKKWVNKNVLINTIRVGATNTKLHKKLPKKNLKHRVKLIPINRMANTKEIANFVFFLGSNNNTYISHQVIPISGGE